MNHLADSIEMEEQRKRTLQNGLLAFLKKDPTHPLYERYADDFRKGTKIHRVVVIRTRHASVDHSTHPRKYMEKRCRKDLTTYDHCGMILVLG